MNARAQRNISDAGKITNLQNQKRELTLFQLFRSMFVVVYKSVTEEYSIRSTKHMNIFIAFVCMSWTCTSAVFNNQESGAYFSRSTSNFVRDIGQTVVDGSLQLQQKCAAFKSISLFHHNTKNLYRYFQTIQSLYINTLRKTDFIVLSHSSIIHIPLQ